MAVAARGRPLGSGGGSGNGLPLTFWDYVFTSFLIVEVFMILAALVFMFFMRRERDRRRQDFSRRTAKSLAILLGLALFVVIVGRHVDLHRLLHLNGRSTTPTTAAQPFGKNAKGHGQAEPRHVQFRWEELAIVLGLLLGLGVLAAATRGRLAPALDRRPAPEVLAAALDESVADLRADPDVRRAIIAAYARMERALAAAGLPRHHAETPLEYVERALLTLDASATAVRRLTDLFQWARFSRHEPDPAMRDEAIEALIAVRDELRASELAPA